MGNMVYSLLWGFAGLISSTVALSAEGSKFSYQEPWGWAAMGSAFNV